MSLPVVVSSTFHVGVKGRVMLPAAVRRAAQVDEGAEVVARPDGEGRVLIETVSSIRDRVWAAAPQPSGRDMADDLRALRNEDNRSADDASVRRVREVGSEQDSAFAGAALLAHLGL